MYFSLTAGAMCIPADAPTPPGDNATSFVGIASTTHGTGLASPTIPAHLGPTGTQKDLIVACLVNSPTNVVPTMPSGEGWSFVGGSAANAGLAGTGLALLWIWKWADTNAEAFGTPANATRAVVWVYRYTVAPASVPFPGTLGTNNPAKGTRENTSDVLHVAHTVIDAPAHLLAVSVSKANVTFTERTGLVSNAVIGTTGGKTGYGRSNGAVSTWTQQLGATSGSTDSISSVLELAN
jgi:hypothetical protein